jgi:hypothetical protein
MLTPIDFDFIDEDAIDFGTCRQQTDELLDLPLLHSTGSFLSTAPPAPATRPFDCPSMKKYYGRLTFIDAQYPIIYR